MSRRRLVAASLGRNLVIVIVRELEYIHKVENYQPLQVHIYNRDHTPARTQA